MNILGLAFIAGLGYGAYKLVSARERQCQVVNPAFDHWARTFTPPLAAYQVNLSGTPPSYSALADALGVSALSSVNATVVIVNIEGDFYVYDTTGIPRLSPNLKDSYCRFLFNELDNM
jgi:hypothetical protein